jgi:hypothetical protein
MNDSTISETVERGLRVKVWHAVEEVVHVCVLLTVIYPIGHGSEDPIGSLMQDFTREAVWNYFENE